MIDGTNTMNDEEFDFEEIEQTFWGRFWMGAIAIAFVATAVIGFALLVYAVAIFLPGDSIFYYLLAVAIAAAIAFVWWAAFPLMAFFIRWFEIWSSRVKK